MQYASIKSERLVLGISGMCLFFLALLWVNFWQMQRQDRMETVQAAIERNTNLAVALQQYAISTIRNADAGLEMLQLEYEIRGSNIDIEKLLGGKIVSSDIFKGVGILDEKGSVVKSNANFDRNAFRFPLSLDTGKIAISKPVPSAKLGRPVINFSRELFTNQRLTGVVVIQVVPETFTAFYDQANLLPSDIISLIAPDGITYARRTGRIQGSGENISKSPLFIHAAKNPDSFYFAKDAIHGIPTFFSYRTLTDYPVIATVGRAEQDVLAGYYTRKKRDLVSAVIISVLMIVFSIFVTQVLFHRKKTAQEQLAAEQKYQRQLTEQIISTQEREREVIGNELHDNVNQVLTTVKLYLELIAQNRAGHEQLVGKSTELLQGAITEIRNLSHRLSSPTLGTRSLVDSIRALTETVAETGGFRITFTYGTYRVHLLTEQQLALFRIVQEQLNNIVKHADASEVDVILSQDAERTQLVIEDDGKGFDIADIRKGIGLNNISTRAAVLNGNAVIESAAGRGCRLVVTLPLHTASAG